MSQTLSKIRKAGLTCFIALGMLILPAVSHAQAENWTVNFRDTEIGELIRFVAEATGRTIVVDPAVRGNVQVVSSTPVDSNRLYELFLAVLDVHGFAAVESGDIVRVVPVVAATMQPVPIGLGTAPTGDGLVTQVIQVNNISAVQLVPVLRPLAAQEAQMTAYAASNSIIVTDTAANVERIRSMVAFIDASSVRQSEVFRLENASATEVVTMLEALRGDVESPDSNPVQLVADARTNSVVITGSQVQIQALRPLLQQLDTPLTRDGNVNVVYLQYARADELAPLLNGIIRSSTDTEGTTVQTATVEADAATNALIITADADILQALKNVIARLDIRRAQVLVEAVIVELSGDRGQDLGVQWLFLNDNGSYGSSSTGSPISAGIAGAALSGGATDANGNPVDIRGPLAEALAGTRGQILGVGRLDNDLSFNVLINALQSDDAANILSTPSLLTLDNEEAVITVGRNVPFITGSFTSTGNNSSNPDNPFQTIERQNVGVTLRVTPHINEGDSLVLELSQEVSSLLGAGGVLLNGNPITNERLIETTVLTDNGQTVILGGLIEDSINQSNQRVPLLGSIPGLGRLFRNDASTVSKTHLLVFLRATIMREARALEAATAEKYSFIRDEQQQRAETGAALVPDEAFPLLPAWETLLRELEQGRQGAASGE